MVETERAGVRGIWYGRCRLLSTSSHQKTSEPGYTLLSLEPAPFSPQHSPTIEESDISCAAAPAQTVEGMAERISALFGVTVTQVKFVSLPV